MLCSMTNLQEWLNCFAQHLQTAVSKLCAQCVPPQEAISCWGHLVSSVYCPSATAASYAATDLVPPVLGKLTGRAEGLVRASGCTPTPGQAKTFDRPLPLESAVQVPSRLCT